MKVYKHLALATVVLFALTACTATGGSKGSQGASSLPSTSPAAVGSLSSVTWNDPDGEPPSIDPGLSAAPNNSPIISNMCDSLLKYNESNTLVPSLASSFTQPNPQTLVLNLRSDVKFWDGHPLTPADVVYDLDRQRDPAFGAPFGSSYFTDIADISATGPNQVTIKFTEPDEVFKYVLGTSAGQISEAAYVKAEGSKYGSPNGGLMCSGPFKFDKWTAGQSISMTANSSYWNPSLRPKVKKVTFTFLSDPSALTNALTTGQIDGSSGIAESQVSQLQKSGAGTVYAGQGTLFQQVLFTTRKGPASDPNVRKAMSLALDRKLLADSIFGNGATPVWSVAFPATWGYSANIFKKTYETLPGQKVDLSEAMKLVNAAGPAAKKPMSVNITSGDAPTQEVATYMKSQLAKIGLTLDIKVITPDQQHNLWADPKAMAQYDMMLIPNYLDFPDPAETALFAVPGGGYNLSGYNNPEVTKLLAEAKGTADDNQRATLLSQAIAIFQGQDTNNIPLVNYPNLVFMGKRITGAPTSLVQQTYGPWAASLGASK